jgi:DNA-directed RNA polymerase II subunit RPB2
MGECRNDYGGYFIIDGKEKTLVCQEKFADNMLYIRSNKADEKYSHSAEIRSVSEDASKPIRTSAIKIVAPSPSLSNNQIVVFIPNVRKPIPLFILMRALGVISDKNIIEYCLLDLDKNETYIDLFIPSIHDANKIFNQETALRFIASFTKRRTITGTLDILMNYFLPHIGEQNFIDKAYFVGYMVNRLLRVFTKEDKPTDRDNFRFKRIELSGSLIYDLFREYYLIQKRDIALKIDKEHYFHKGNYADAKFPNLIENNILLYFKERIVESGFKKAFKGNWGAEAHTKRVGAIQDLNRLSWNTFISQLRKFNLPLDASAKVVGPRLLHSSQWGYIDPVDTPDGGNIGLHKHMAISTVVTSGSSSIPMIEWLRAKTNMRILQECEPKFLGNSTKIIVNGNWIGSVDNPIETCSTIRMFRRNGLIPAFTSVSFNYENNEIFIYTDSGRLSRPIYYIDNKTRKISYDRPEIIELINSNDYTWEKAVCGFHKKAVERFI